MRCPNIKEIEDSARGIAWCWPVEDVFADKNFYLRLVMQYGGPSNLKIAQRYFTQIDFIEVSAVSVFDGIVAT